MSKNSLNIYICFFVSCLTLMNISTVRGMERKDVNYMPSSCSRLSSTIKYIEPINIKVSAKGINHISLAPQVVTAVWGDESHYSINLSDNGSELFITSKLSTGEFIPLAVVIAGGRVVDFSLEVIESDLPKIVTIDMRDRSNSIGSNQRREIKQMLYAMQSGIKGKYYTDTEKKKLRNLFDDKLAVERIGTYRLTV